MDIILRADVDTLGRVGDHVTVKDGYARNYLIPQGLAMRATRANTRAFEVERKKLEAKMEQIRQEAKSQAEKLDETEVEIRVRVGENDKLYGSVTSAMIGDALAEQGVDLDKRKIQLDSPIRALGEYEVPVKLHPEVSPTVTVKVLREGGSFEEEIASLEEAPVEAREPATPEPVEGEEAEVSSEPETEQPE
ncbi:50S ribosomal protein L9 [Desulfohalovibrio reitneri]|uniref:50S ribosomal protein L9 n=1 Tax=Desulfohalovibrio reitneri TaxID=1307759 RepID=UPI0004A6F4C5|nr:50S ribosomal protein L9 [Desulfohalovibrio reitneri]